MVSIPKAYYYVPPCPACNSKRTGRYMKTGFGGTKDLENEALKNGEIVRQTDKVPDENLFCEECEFQWKGIIHTSYITKERLLQEIEDRGLKDKIVSLENERVEHKKNMSKTEKLMRKFWV